MGNLKMLSFLFQINSDDSSYGFSVKWSLISIGK